MYIFSYACHQALRWHERLRCSNQIPSKWMNDHGKRFAWQEGYGAFSVSASNLPQVMLYVQNQEAHHRKVSFEEEYMTLLRKHGVKFDPKYVLG
jgi:putative transposase